MNYQSFNTHQRHTSKECPSTHESKGWLLVHESYPCLCYPMITARIHMSHMHPPTDFIAEILLTPEHIIFCSCHVCSDRCPTLMTYLTFPSISTLQKHYQKIWSIILVIFIPFFWLITFLTITFFSSLFCTIGWIYLWNSHSQVRCDIYCWKRWCTASVSCSLRELCTSSDDERRTPFSLKQRHTPRSPSV